MIRAVVLHGEIAGVGVGVEDTVDDDHLEVCSLECRRQRGAVQPLRFEFVEIVDLRAADVLHREHARRTHLVDGFGDDDILAVGEVAADLFEDVPLAGVVHLLSDRLGELVGETVQRERPPLVDHPHEQRNRPPQYLQIGLDERLDVRAANLDRDLFAVVLGEIDLSQARAADRIGIELVEHLVDRPEFVLDDLL
jgi:hypothetical protein